MIKKRYLIFASFIALIVLGSWLIPPVLPVIQLPGEVLIPWSRDSFLYGLFGYGFTNTFLATLLTYGILALLILTVRAWTRTADEVPTGFYNVFEAIIEGAYNFVQGIAGQWTRQFFPFFMTFILLILVANWMELIPGVDSIGIWENIPHHKAELAVRAAEDQALVTGDRLTADEIHAIEHAAEETYYGTGDLRRGLFLLKATENDPESDRNWTIVPFIRVPATDLNFTFALALISVIATQYFGLRALGASYLTKFLNFSPKRMAKNPLAVIDPVVGILELISEIAKIVSFAFRLFGVIFAGQVLLFIIGFLLPVANVAVFGLEFFVGAIQAVVFAMLTLIFMTLAVQPHHHDEEEAHH
jgi:F-type H+-transporting ATPase subunit a